MCKREVGFSYAGEGSQKNCKKGIIIDRHNTMQTKEQETAGDKVVLL